jgi:hypothetical protein
MGKEKYLHELFECTFFQQTPKFTSLHFLTKNNLYILYFSFTILDLFVIHFFKIDLHHYNQDPSAN